MERIIAYWEELKRRQGEIKPEVWHKILARIIVHSKISQIVEEAKEILQSYNNISIETLTYLVRHCGSARNQEIREWAAAKMLKPENRQKLSNYHLRVIIIYSSDKELKKEAVTQLLMKESLEFDDIEVIKKYFPALAKIAKRKMRHAISFLLEEITGIPSDMSSNDIMKGD